MVFGSWSIPNQKSLTKNQIPYNPFFTFFVIKLFSMPRFVIPEKKGVNSQDKTMLTKQ